LVSWGSPGTVAGGLSSLHQNGPPAPGLLQPTVNLSPEQAGICDLDGFARFCLDLGLAFAGQCIEYIYSSQAGVPAGSQTLNNAVAAQ